MLEPQLPLCGVTIDAVIPSRVWADFLIVTIVTVETMETVDTVVTVVTVERQ